MIVKELAQYLDDNNIADLSTNMFIGEFPKETEDCIILVAVPSTEPDRYTGVEYQTIDIWSRYSNTESGYNKLQQIFDLLNRLNKLILPNYEIYNISALGRIEDFDRDIEGRKLQKLTIQLIYRSLALVS